MKSAGFGAGAIHFTLAKMRVVPISVCEMLASNVFCGWRRKVMPTSDTLVIHAMFHKRSLRRARLLVTDAEHYAVRHSLEAPPRPHELEETSGGKRAADPDVLRAPVPLSAHCSTVL
jgi:hypothetical protein